MEFANTQKKQTRGSGGLGKLPQQIKGIEAVYDNVYENAREVADIAMEGIKVVMSETGVIKGSFIKHATLQDVTIPSPLSKQYATPNRYSFKANNDKAVNREVYVGTSDANSFDEEYEASSEQIFVCGKYFLPLNLVFSVNASKIVAQSQLIDGINIVERISKSARTISCSFRIERNEYEASDYNEEEEAAFNIREYTKDTELIPRKRVLSADEREVVGKLTNFINDLYENEDVFQIVNPVLNDEFGIDFCFIKSFSFNPSVGSTLCTINIQMQEVNTSDKLIFVEETSEKTKTTKE